MVLLPGMLQTLFSYTAVWSGLVMSPAGLFSIPTMAIMGHLIGKKVDAQWIIVLGAVLMWAGASWYARLNLDVGPGRLIWPRVIQQVGTASLFAPLSVAAFLYLSKELRGSAAGIFAALRNEGGSAGTALGNTLVTRRIPVHTDRLVEYLNPANPAFSETMRSLRASRGRVTGFSPGTGAATALLPAQNATGNFVKIVQRLPVRVDVIGGNPPETPLFAGMSVESRIFVNEKPEGPHAGQRLRGPLNVVTPDGKAPASAGRNP
jgi:hypothetical protein